MSSLGRDGVRLAHDEAGHGEPPLLFVHGWTCDRSALAAQREHFARRHRVIAVDLRGHGRSDRPAQEYTMAGFAEDLAWLCERLGVEAPLVIGHSMGGVVALELAACHPDVPAAIVTLDAPILPSSAMRRRVTPLLDGPDARQAQRAFVGEALFLPTDDPRRRARLLEQMAETPQHVMSSAFKHMLACDTADAVAKCRVPFLYLYAAKPSSDLARLRQLCPHVVTGQTVGAATSINSKFPRRSTP